MVLQELYRSISNDLLVVVLVSVIIISSYLVILKMVRFFLKRYGIHTLSYLITILIIIFWIFSDFSTVSSSIDNRDEKLRFLINGFIGLMILGLSLIVFMIAKSLSQIKKNKNKV